MNGAEDRLVGNGAVKIVSIWWSDPYVVGVLADGRTLLVSEPGYEPSSGAVPGPPAELVARIAEDGALCRECESSGRHVFATATAYCCGLKEWLPVCAHHKEEMGDHYGPHNCP